MVAVSGLARAAALASVELMPQKISTRALKKAT
jgi:hypothetical protein